MRQWRPSTKVKEHKEERSLERWVDMEVSRKKDLGFLGSLAEARRTSEQEYFSRTVVRNSRQNSVVLQFPVTDNESGLQRFG
jgi:hypothetical protein